MSYGGFSCKFPSKLDNHILLCPNKFNMKNPIINKEANIILSNLVNFVSLLFSITKKYIFKIFCHLIINFFVIFSTYIGKKE